jgi:hypothetical protein
LPIAFPRKSIIIDSIALQLPDRRRFGPAIYGSIGGRDYLFADVYNDITLDSANTGILILDPHEPENPRRVALVTLPDVNMVVKNLALSGSFLYVSASNSLWIIDVSYPASPREVSRTTSIKALNLVISGKHAFIHDADSPLNFSRVTIADISDPANPYVVGHFDLPVNITDDSVQVLKVVGPLLFALEYNSSNINPNPNGLFIFDISEPLKPRQLSYFENTAAPGVVYVPVPPNAPLSTFEAPSLFYDMAISGNYAYLAAGGPDGMQVLDISNPSDPKMVTHVPGTATQRIFLYGHWVYLFTRYGVVAVDISDPRLPQPSVFQGPGEISDLAITADHLYFFMNNGFGPGIGIYSALP